MLLLQAEFLAMLLIIVYVGAVAVLFLFVVMMLQTNYTHTKSPFQATTALVIGFLIFIQIFGLLMFNDIKSVNTETTKIPLTFTAKELYINHFVNFQILGLILLIAMIGAMILTHMKSTTFVHKQKISEQVLRKKEDCITMAKPEIGKGVAL